MSQLLRIIRVNMTTTITFSALFTSSGGTPATGLTLSDIDIYLYSVHATTGVVAAIWNTENPTAEISNLGMYFRQYASADVSTYNYFARAVYTGGTSLDSDNVYVVFSRAEIDADTVASEISNTVTLSSPLSDDGNKLDIIWGDDYSSSDNRELVWSSTGWPDLSGATITFKCWNPKSFGDRFSFSGSTVSVGGATQSVQLELTDTQTKTLQVGKRRYRYEVEAEISGRKVTLVSSESTFMTVAQSYD